MLRLASRMEGHPDNVAACLLGGFTVAWTDDDPQGFISHAIGLTVHPDVVPVIFVPDLKSSTSKTRKLLPEQVPHRDASANVGRAALLVEALTRRPDLLFAATADTLHQQYRAPAMPRSAALVERLRNAGIPAAMSGAGPTVLALTSRDTTSAALEMAVRWFTATAVGVDVEGARVVPLDE